MQSCTFQRIVSEAYSWLTGSLRSKAMPQLSFLAQQVKMNTAIISPLYALGIYIFETLSFTCQLNLAYTASHEYHAKIITPVAGNMLMPIKNLRTNSR